MNPAEIGYRMNCKLQRIGVLEPPLREQAAVEKVGQNHYSEYQEITHLGTRPALMILFFDHIVSFVESRRPRMHKLRYIVAVFEWIGITESRQKRHERKNRTKSLVVVRV